MSCLGVLRVCGWQVRKFEGPHNWTADPWRKFYKVVLLWSLIWAGTYVTLCERCA